MVEFTLMTREGFFEYLRNRVWRRVPPRFRLGLLLRLTSLVAPRISLHADMRLPIIIVGMLRESSGLGEATRAAYNSLKEAGIPVYGIDLTQDFRRRAVHNDFAFEDGRSLKGAGTILLHVAPPVVPLVLMRLGRGTLRSKHIIAHWFWELDQMPVEWRPSLRFVHEVFVNTHFVAGAVRSLATKTPVKVVTYPIAPNLGAPPRERKDQPFTVLVVFDFASNFVRKNPCAAIDAFKQAFGDSLDARLIVKFSNPESWHPGLDLLHQHTKGAQNIELIGEVLPGPEMDSLYGRADAIVSLHRSEGLGLVLITGMLRGIPVIATNWSGNTDFVDSKVGIPVPYKLVSVQEPQGHYTVSGAVWAEPDVAFAAEALRRLKSNPEFAAALGAAGRARAVHMFAPENFAAMVKTLLTDYPEAN